MSIYGKLAKARQKFHQQNLKKSGHNKFANYKYFELADFIIPGLECLASEHLVPVISFTADAATMTVYETDGDASITITSPMSEANLKGSHPIQNLGAVQTYLRRYLWVNLLEIVEHDALDSSEPVQDTTISKAQAKKLADLIDSLPDEKASTVTKWVAAKFGTVDKMPSKAYETVINKLEAA